MTDSKIKANQSQQLDALKQTLLQSLAGIKLPTADDMNATNAAFKATAKDATKAAEDSAAVSTTIVDYSRSKIQDLALIDVGMNEALEADLAAKQKLIETNKLKELEAAELAGTAIETYKETVTSQEATENYRRTAARALLAQQEYNANEEAMNNGGILDKVVGWFKKPSLQRELQMTQGELASTQQNRIQGTQLFAQEVESANSIASILFRKDLATNKAKLESSAALLENLAMKRANVNDTIASLQSIHNLDSASVKSLRDKMEILNSQNIYDANTYASVFNMVESENRSRHVDMQIERLAKHKEGMQAIQSGIDAFKAARPDLKNVPDAEQFLALSPQEQELLGWAPELKSFVAGNAMTAVAPYSSTYYKTEAQVTLTPSEVVGKKLTEDAVADYNMRKVQEFEQEKLKSGMDRATYSREIGDPSSKLSQELRTRQLNLADPNSFKKADELGRTRIASLSKDTTALYKGKIIELASIQETLQVPEGEAKFRQLGVPSDVIDLIKSGEYKELESRVASYEDFVKNEQAAVELALEKAFETDERGNKSFSMKLAEKHLQNQAKVLAANYRIQREFTQRTEVPLLSGTKIGMPDPTGKTGSTGIVDMENPANLYIRMQQKLLSKRAKSVFSTSMQGATFPASGRFTPYKPQ